MTTTAVWARVVILVRYLGVWKRCTGRENNAPRDRVQKTQPSQSSEVIVISIPAIFFFHVLKVFFF